MSTSSPDALHQEIGERLRQLRQQLGDRQVDFAERVGWSRPMLSKHERGESRLTIADAVRIAEALESSPIAVILQLLPSTPQELHDPLAQLLRHVQRSPALLAAVLQVAEQMDATVPEAMQTATVVQQDTDQLDDPALWQ